MASYNERRNRNENLRGQNHKQIINIPHTDPREAYIRPKSKADRWKQKVPGTNSNYKPLATRPLVFLLQRDCSLFSLLPLSKTIIKISNIYLLLPLFQALS